MGGLTVIDISTGNNPNYFVGACAGGPFAGQVFAHFESTMAVFHETNGYIGCYSFVAAAWRWCPVGPQHFNCRCTTEPIRPDLLED